MEIKTLGKTKKVFTILTIISALNYLRGVRSHEALTIMLFIGFTNIFLSILLYYKVNLKFHNKA